MFAQLARYAEREGLITEPGFAPKNVRWCISCDRNGRPTGELLDLRTEDQPQGLRFGQAPHLTLGEIKRGGSGTRHFLADALEVVIGFEGEQDPKIAAKHAYFVKLLNCASEFMPVLAMIAKNMSDADVLEGLREQAQQQKAKRTEVATFALSVAGGMQYLIRCDDWRNWWRSFRATLSAPVKKTKSQNGTTERMRCFMTGELVEVAKTHNKIKGLASVGGISSGDVLASFKQDSFQSYGLAQAANVAMSEDASVRYTGALEELIRKGKRFEHAVVAHWYEPGRDLESHHEPGLDLIHLVQGLDDEDEQRDKMRQARQLLDAIKTGTDPKANSIGRTAFHAYSLSGASGRVMVRDVIDGPFSELLQSHADWFDDLSICRIEDDTCMVRAPKFRSVLAATVRYRKGKPVIKDVPPPLEALLWRVALRHTTPFPRDALARTIAHARVEVVAGGAPRSTRYAFLKAVINRSIRLGSIQGGIHPVSQRIDEHHPDAAYHCGRIMAVLAALQYSALGDVGAGVIQRYYAAASVSPALVLGRLTRNAQHHLNKLDGGLRNYYESKIGTILQKVERQFPRTLDLENQSLFALGYYHQLAHDRTPKSSTTQSNKDPESEPNVGEEKSA